MGGEERSQSTDATWDCYRMGQCSGCAHWAHPAMYILNLHPTISFHQSVSLIIAAVYFDHHLLIQSSWMLYVVVPVPMFAQSAVCSSCWSEHSVSWLPPPVSRCRYLDTRPHLTSRYILYILSTYSRYSAYLLCCTWCPGWPCSSPRRPPRRRRRLATRCSSPPPTRTWSGSRGTAPTSRSAVHLN